MIRMPPHIENDWHPVKRTCPGFGKTAAQQEMAIEVYRTPLHKQLRTWWAVMFVVLSVLVLSGCAGDINDAMAVQADYADAVAQAAKGDFNE